MCTGGAYRPFWHDRHLNAASSFQIGVSRGHRIASSGMLPRVLQRWHSTSSHPYPPLRHCAIVGDGCAGPPYWIDHGFGVSAIGFSDRLLRGLARALGAYLRSTGQASVIDGDTLEIHRTRIRLWGVDAPESSQLCRGDDSLLYRCGAGAANDKRPVNCLPISLDRYGRTVATCSVAGADLGNWLVRNGLALDWPQYSKRRYDAAQRDAEQVGRGMWAGSYVEPWLYRVCIRASGIPSNCSDDANAHP
jgi:endonuclease YncB( thermonuclease family)